MAMARKKTRSAASIAVPTRFTKVELSRIERARGLIGTSTRSGFIREAVLTKVGEIEEAGILELRDVSLKEAIAMIERYLRDHPGRHYVSDLVEELGLEPRIAFQAADRLIAAGKARTRGT